MCNEELCFTCQVPRDVEFHLRGVSKDISLESRYYLGHKFDNNTVRYVGYDDNILMWNVKTKQVTLLDHEIGSNILGRVTSLHERYSVGQHDWKINMNGYEREMKLKFSKVKDICKNEPPK